MNHYRPGILIADDHSLIVNGIRSMLAGDYKIVGTARDGRELVTAALRLKPDIIILDVSMPQLNGIEAAKQIHPALPGAHLIFLTMHSEPIYLRKALAAGASAYVLKAGAPGELNEAIRAAMRGEIYISPGFRSDVVAGLRNSSGTLSRESEDLTARQREILQLVVEGRASKEVAHILRISVKTVDFHRARIMTRLGAHSVAELVRIAVERELIPPSSPRSGEGFPEIHNSPKIA